MVTLRFTLMAKENHKLIGQPTNRPEYRCVIEIKWCSGSFDVGETDLSGLILRYILRENINNLMRTKQSSPTCGVGIGFDWFERNRLRSSSLDENVFFSLSRFCRVLFLSKGPMIFMVFFVCLKRL